MLARVRAILVVSIVSAIVWLWAEAESLDERTESASLRFVVPPDRGERLRLDVRDAADRVALELRGSQAALENTRRALESGIDLDITRLAPEGAAGPITIDLAEAIRGFERFAAMNVELLSTSPTRTTVTLVPMRTVSLPVRPDVGDVRLAGEAVVTPASRDVLMPAALAADLVANGAGGMPQLVAPVPAESIEQAAPNEPTSASVRVQLPPALRGREYVELAEPASPVTVAFTVRSTTVERQLDAVPIWIAGPPEPLGGGTVSIAPGQSVVSATIVGPRDAVDAVASGATPLVGLVSLDATELLSGTATKRPEWFVLADGRLSPLPAGVRVTPGRDSVTVSVNAAGREPG